MRSILRVINSSLKEQYTKSLNTKNSKNMFLFFYSYMFFLEDENGTARHLLIFENPRDLDKRYLSFVKDFNYNCLSFLMRTLKTSKNSKTLAEAQVFLGMAYEFGVFGLEVNKSRAFSYYSAAAKQNNRLGTFRVAQCYEKGVGRPQNIGKALYFYRCSAKLGHVHGMHTYGSILIRGDLNTQKDFDTGLYYLKLAANKSSSIYPYALYDLAKIYEPKSQIKDIMPDAKYSVRLCERGASLGCPNCQHRLAKCYEYADLGLSKNIAKAVEFYKRSADFGHLDSQYSYSKLLFTGVDGVLAKDYKDSYHYALKAATRGHGDAAYIIGEFFESGCGVKKSELTSYWWYIISTEFGNKHAKVKRNKLKYKVDLKNEASVKYSCCKCFF